MYIYRELLDKLVSFYQESSRPKGLILSGVVGCGKTTLIEKLIQHLSKDHQVFSYSGDDTLFRQKLIENSQFIYQDVSSKSSKKAFVFVDEVQKSEEVFDALKIAFDRGKISFIVSGSNPAYLSTVAKKRLQRRADQMLMLPISLAELAIENQWATPNDLSLFGDILWRCKNIDEVVIPKINVPENLSRITEQFLTFGGLPLALVSDSEESKLREIRLTIERGFDLMAVESNSMAEVVRAELARLHSSEFTYKNIMEKTRVRRRDSINQIVDQLMNHGYLVRKRPVLFVEGKTSYLSVFSYVDPGIVSYLTGELQDYNRGPRIEGAIHARLSYLVYNSVYKSELGYYKPHSLDTNSNVRYSPGEIDFILQTGKRKLPIEVKSTRSISDIDLTLIKSLIASESLPFGVVLYGGAPFVNKKDQVIFWPYWLV